MTTVHQARMTRLGDLVPADYNPRKITTDARKRLRGSLEEWGLVENLVANSRTGRLVGGHQRLVGLIDLCDGDMEKEVPVVWLDLDEQKERTLNVALNGEYGAFDSERLRDVLAGIEKSVPDLLDKTGLSHRSIGSILDSITQKSLVARPESVDALRDVPQVFSTGHVERINNEHTIVCMDSTRQDEVAAIVGDGAAQMVFLDPPYCAKYDPETSVAQNWQGESRDSSGGKGRKSSKVGKIHNDGLPIEDWERIVEGMLLSAKRILRSDGCLFVCIGQRGIFDLQRVWQRCSLHLSTIVVWDKEWIRQGRQDFRPQYECIFYGWPSKSTHRRGFHRDESDVWSIPTDAASDYVHPSQKPVALYSRAIRNMTRHGELVVDLCCGSGGLLLAAKAQGRRAVIMDMDPRYCDVALARYRSMEEPG